MSPFMQVLPESLRSRSLMLSNATQSPLTFRLKVAAPFVMVDLDYGSSENGRSRTMQTGFHTLHPRHNIMVLSYRTVVFSSQYHLL